MMRDNLSFAPQPSIEKSSQGTKALSPRGIARPLWHNTATPSAARYVFRLCFHSGISVPLECSATSRQVLLCSSLGVSLLVVSSRPLIWLHVYPCPQINSLHSDIHVKVRSRSNKWPFHVGSYPGIERRHFNLFSHVRCYKTHYAWARIDCDSNLKKNCSDIPTFAEART